jgi:Ca-activated chloride channel family protein
MHRTALAATLLAAFGLLPPPAARAREAGARQVPSFSAGTAIVLLSATALDRSGRPVRDLSPHEFRILEEGRPQPLHFFAAAADVPARILLLVDASGSMNNELQTTSAKMAALQVLAALAPEDEVALAGFDHRYFGLVRFTRDKQSVLKAFDELEFFGSTALHDALERAASDLASHGEGRRAVVVVTDGIDTASQHTPEQVIARSRALDVPIYAVSVVSPLDDPASPRFLRSHLPAAAARGAELLSQYAAHSGGKSFTVSDFSGLREAALTVAGEIKHQYRLGYDPPAGPAGFRRVEVRSTRKGVTIRTRSGYVPRP